LQAILHALRPPAIAQVVAGAGAILAGIMPHAGEPGPGFLVVGSLVLIGGGLGIRRVRR
jgi:hypothetical protein